MKLISGEQMWSLGPESTIQESELISSEQERIRTLPDFDSSIGVIEWEVFATCWLFAILYHQS